MHRGYRRFYTPWYALELWHFRLVAKDFDAWSLLLACSHSRRSCAEGQRLILSVGAQGRGFCGFCGTCEVRLPFDFVPVCSQHAVFSHSV